MPNPDFVVLGAGVAGLTIARELARRKLSVVVLEREQPGGATSRAAAGILDPFHETDEPTPLLALGLAALAEYPDFVAELEASSGERVEFEQLGVLYLATSEADKALLLERVTWQRRQNVRVEFWTSQSVASGEPAAPRGVLGGVLYPRSAKINPAKLMDALTADCARLGIEIRWRESAYEVEASGGRVMGVRTRGGTVACGAVVCATGAWQDVRLGARSPVAVSPVRGQILILDRPAGRDVHHILHTVRCAYVVPIPERRLLVGSTLEEAGFDAVTTREGRADILKRASEMVEGIARFKVRASWAGLRPRAERGAPVIGQGAVDGLHLAMGYYRSGILIAPCVARRLAAHVAGADLDDLLRPFKP